MQATPTSDEAQSALPSKDELLSLARLARLRLDDEQVAGLQQEIAQVLAFFRQLDEADGDPELFAADEHEPSLLLEADEPAAPLSLDQVFANSSQRHRPYFFFASQRRTVP
ncbi:MAG: hypothetical protein RBU37_20750 [Myxococcota bacterium]|nr:hypothetical protein [Myxococcota bacterium]